MNSIDFEIVFILQKAALELHELKPDDLRMILRMIQKSSCSSMQEHLTFWTVYIKNKYYVYWISDQKIVNISFYL